MLIYIFSLSKKALEESSKEVSKILSKLNFQFNLDKVSNFGKEVVFVTMGNEAEVIAFKEAAGTSTSAQRQRYRGDNDIRHQVETAENLHLLRF